MDVLPIAVLAGGLATRMRPLTETIPKSLLTVAGEPFIAHQLRLFQRNGIKRVVLCVGYLGQMLQDYVGDGAEWGLSVSYSFDGDTLRGTGGALRAALPLLGPEFMVVYGDSYLDIAYASVADAFRASGKKGLMTIFRNAGAWDTSNVLYADGLIQAYDKVHRIPEMAHIDYGLGVLQADVLAEYPEGQSFDLATVYGALVGQRELSAYEAPKRFYEIGSPEGLAETNAYLLASSSVQM